MHIVHVITKLDVGGAQTVVRELTWHQQRQGNRVSIVTGTLGPVALELSAAGVSVHHLESLRHSIDPIQDRRAGRELQTLLHEISPDVVHSHSSKTGLLGRRAARKLDLPSVYTAHGWPFQKGAPMKQRLLSWAGETSAGRSGGEIVCVTRNDFRLATKLRLAPVDRIHLVSNGIGDPLETLPTRCAEPDSGEFRVIMVARFASPKRHDLVTAALRLLPDRVTVTFAGDGPKMAAAIKRSESVSSRVHFPGSCDPRPLLDRADAFVLASDYEGLSMSVLEAMRSGLPIVANDLPGVRDAVEHGVHGYLTAKTPIGIANALRKLIGDRSLGRELGSAAFSCWQQNFTTDAMAKKYASIYDLART